MPIAEAKSQLLTGKNVSQREKKSHRFKRVVTWINDRFLCNFVGYKHSSISWPWKCLREILPLFLANGDKHEANNENNNNYRIAMLLEARNVLCLKGVMKDCWQEEAVYRNDEEGQKLLTQQFKFPPIVFCICSTNTVMCNKLCLPSSDYQHADDAWTEAFFEQVIFSEIRQLLDDAVESCSRRDLSFYLYRSLKKVVFYHVSVHLRCSWCDVWTAEQRERLLERVDLLLKGRIALTFQQRVVHEVFADFLLNNAKAATQLGWAKLSDDNAAADMPLTFLRMPTFSAVVSLTGCKKFQTILL